VMFDVNSFVGQVRQHDDITCLVLRVTPSLNRAELFAKSLNARPPNFPRSPFSRIISL